MKLKVEEEPGSTEAYPADAAPFASKMKSLSLEYRAKDDADVTGTLFLSFAGHPLDFELEGAKDGVFFEQDMNGTGLAAFSIRDAKGKRSILWDVETRAKFSSLDEYLTLGARYAFAYGGSEPYGCWQTKPKATPLAERSAPKSLPDSQLKKALTERGTSPEMAAELIGWLGKDVTLLLPRAS